MKVKKGATVTRQLGRRTSAAASLGALALAAALVPAGVGAHELDHPAPSAEVPPPPPTFQAGGTGASWELIDTVATANPHTDLDFFTSGGDTYASVGTLAIGPNSGGQTIVKLTDGETVDPRLVSNHPSASCLSEPSQALGLQHDVEATPKGAAPLSSPNPFAVRADAQLLLDATDNPGRCHDQGSALGFTSAPQGGLEIVDVTDPTRPVEIGLVSHIGEAHTVNVDPKRPHIAYAVSSDAVNLITDTQDLDGDGNREERIRQNEDPASGERFDLDGFEVVDLSSCMNFPPGTSVADKRLACNPAVYRYRYPTIEMALGHTVKGAVNGCHELEVYASDRLTCAAIATTMVFDMSGAFDDNGTPDLFTDDRPQGTPLPCRRRGSSSLPALTTGAPVIDCVDGTGEGTDDLTVAKWLRSGAPSLAGVQWLGTVHHQGRGGTGSVPPFDATEDIEVSHEAELSESGNLLFATDERGGGVTPPGASCSPGTDNTDGNGGIHAYRVDRLDTALPPPPAGPEDEAFDPYARTPDGGKAIYRAPVRTQPQPDFCTAHVFQLIPGQNRIFMGWYSQGTQVVDFVEQRGGAVSFREAAFFIPTDANEWVSHVFKLRRNKNKTFTYWGATGDFNLGTAGRNAIDVWKVTLPPPPKPGRPE